MDFFRCSFIASYSTFSRPLFLFLSDGTMKSLLIVSVRGMDHIREALVTRKRIRSRFCAYHLPLFYLPVPRGALNEPDLCFMWRSHVKTFDGRYMFFPGRCTYKLIHDCQDDLFSVHVFTDPLCKDLANCRRAVNLYLGGLDIKVIFLGVE